MNIQPSRLYDSCFNHVFGFANVLWSFCETSSTSSGMLLRSPLTASERPPLLLIEWAVSAFKSGSDDASLVMGRLLALSTTLLLFVLVFAPGGLGFSLSLQRRKKSPKQNRRKFESNTPQVAFACVYVCFLERGGERMGLEFLFPCFFLSYGPGQGKSLVAMTHTDPRFMLSENCSAWAGDNGGALPFWLKGTGTQGSLF